MSGPVNTGGSCSVYHGMEKAEIIFQYHQATSVQTKMTILTFISTVQTQLPFSLAAVGVQQTWLSCCCVLLWSCLDPS